MAFDTRRPVVFVFVFPFLPSSTPVCAVRSRSVPSPRIFPCYGWSPVFHPRVCFPFPTKYRRHRMERDDLTPRSPPVYRYCSIKQQHLSCQGAMRSLGTPKSASRRRRPPGAGRPLEETARLLGRATSSLPPFCVPVLHQDIRPSGE